MFVGGKPLSKKGFLLPVCSIRTMHTHTKLVTKNVWEFSGKSQEKGPLAENDKTERARGVGRKTTQEIGRELKWQPWDAKQEEKQKIWHLLLPSGATVLGYWTLCFQMNRFNCIYWESNTVRSWSPHWWCGKGDDDDDDGFYTALFSG